MTMHRCIRWILRLVILLAIVLPGFSSATSATENAPVPSKDEVAQSIEAHYRALVDLTARVTQKNSLKTLGKMQTFEGTLSIKKPGRLRIDYTNGQTIVLDGKTVLFYSKKSGQAIRRAFSDIERANVPVAFLLGASEIRNDFDIAAAGADGRRMIDLLPKKSGAAMKKIRLQADEAGRIAAMTIFNQSGNTTEITFADVKEGAGVKDKVFLFKVPKGTEVIEQ